MDYGDVQPYKRILRYTKDLNFDDLSKGLRKQIGHTGCLMLK